MDKINKIVDSIIDELDGRKGFEFGDIDKDILNEIKNEIAKLILPLVVKSLPTEEDLNLFISKVTPIMEEEDYEPEQILKWVCAFKDGFKYGQKPKK